MAAVGRKAPHLGLQVLHFPAGLVFFGKAPDQQGNETQFIHDTENDPGFTDSIYFDESSEDPDIVDEMHEHHGNQDDKDQRSDFDQYLIVQYPGKTVIHNIQNCKYQTDDKIYAPLRFSGGTAGKLVFPEPGNQGVPAFQTGFFQYAPCPEDIEYPEGDISDIDGIKQ